MLKKLFIAILCLALNSGALAAMGQECEVAPCCCDSVGSAVAYADADARSSCCCDGNGESTCKMDSSKGGKKSAQAATINTSPEAQRAQPLIASTKGAITTPAPVIFKRADLARTLPLASSAFLVQRLLC